MVSIIGFGGKEYSTDNMENTYAGLETPESGGGPFPYYVALIADMAALIGSGYAGTSTTSYDLTTGTKVFVTQDYVQWKAGAPVKVASRADPADNWAIGNVTADMTDENASINITYVSPDASGGP